MSRNRLTLVGVLFGVLILFADQASKQWILFDLDLPSLGRVAVLPMLSFTMVWNRGVTFGLLTDFGGRAFVLAAIAMVIVAALAVWLRRAERVLVAAALGAIAGGAVGNVIDRFRWGAVVDFLHFHVGGWSWYVFNVADAAIVCGVAALVLDSVLPHRAGSGGDRLAGAGEPR